MTTPSTLSSFLEVQNASAKSAHLPLPKAKNRTPQDPAITAMVREVLSTAKYLSGADYWQDLAEFLNIDKKLLNKYRSGEKHVDGELLVRLNELTGESVESMKIKIGLPFIPNRRRANV